MGIESAITCNRLGAIGLLEETGFLLGMLWLPMVLAVSHAQRPPRQRLRCVPGMFNSLEVQVLYPT
jgi:hypothetical protein